MKKILCLLISILALALCIAGCGSKEPKETAAKEMVIGDTTFGSEHWEETVNPHRTYSGWACIRYGVGETLVRYGDDMELQPWLAQSWSNDGHLTWTITLKDNISFSSGRKMDAAAVKECLEHLLQEHDRAPMDTKIASMEAAGQVLTITTREPNPALMHYLGDPYGCIIDVQASDFKAGIVAGTGPYKVQELRVDEYLILTKNANYWNGVPKLDKLTIRALHKGDTVTAALQSGAIDAAYGVPYEAFSNFPNSKYQFSSVATSRAFLATMNMTSPLLQDAAVRQAIAMGIDKGSFVKTLLDGHGAVAAGAFPAGMGSFGSEHITAPGYDPAAAKALLENAGWVDSDGDGIREKNGTRLHLRWLTYPSRQELPLLAEAAQASLKEIGVEVEVNCTPNRRQFLKDMASWDIYGSAMITAPAGDPQSFFTTSCLPGQSYNFGAYNNPQATALIQQLAAEFDPAKRGQLAVQLQQLIVDDYAYIFCSFLEMNMVSKANVVGYTAHPCDYYQVSAELDIR